MKKRIVAPGEVHHVYQKTENAGLLFYTVSDYIVFFTLFCSIANRLEIQVLALCPMPDHLHHLTVISSYRQLSYFVQQYTQLFAQLWNKSRGVKGQLFHHNFGSSIKKGNKSVRTALAYNYNNAVERKLVEKAEDYRWNYLPYARSDAPFAPKLIPSEASRAMQRVLKEVKDCHRLGKYLCYAQLDRWQKQLTPVEWQQLVDYIVSLWNVVDFTAASAYYGSMETMIRAFHDNSGSEYDIPEDWDPYSDEVYADCTRILLSGKHVDDLREIPSLPEERKQQLYWLLQRRTTARPKQICKYLHLSAIPSADGT